MPDRSSAVRQSTFVELLQERVAGHPERPAFVFLQEGQLETERWSYADLDRRARAIAAHLQARGLQGERALLLYNPGLDFVAGFFGCLYADVTAVPAYPPRSNQLLTRLASIIRDAEVAVALTASAGLEGIAERLKDLGPAAPPLLIATDSIEAAEAEAWQPPRIEPDSLAFLQYTSGSTGNPKGVMVSHANLVQNSRLINLSFEDSDQSVGVSWLPPYHDMGLVGGILQPLFVGSTMVVMPPVSFLQRPIRWLEAISRYRGTTSGGPNFAYEFCARQIRREQLEGLDLSSWSLAFTGAEPVRAETLDLFCEIFGPCGFRREAFLPCYGLAENTLIVTGAGKRQLPVVRRFDADALIERRVVEQPAEVLSGCRTLVASGPALGDVGLRIVDPEQGIPLGEGEIGEIWVSGASVAKGYRNQEERSRETFQARLEGDPASYLRTGDLGFLLDGQLFVNGRLKDLIIIRGRNHYPQDIEASVETSHAALRTGCGAAFAVEEDGEERLVIVQEVERSALRRLDADAVTTAIRAAVNEQHQLQPAAILLLKTGAIPKTSSGKIQRFACRQRYLDGSLEPVGQWRQATAAPAGLDGRRDASSGDTISATAAATPHRAAAEPAGGTALSSLERRIQAWFRTYLSETLGLPAGTIGLETPLSQVGLDSMAAVRLTADLEDWLARAEPGHPRLALSPTLAYDHPSIGRIATAIAQAMQEPAAAAAPVSSGGSNDGPRPLRDDDVVVVGLGCRFPGAGSPQEFWELLERGGEAIRTASEAGAEDRGFGGAAAERAGFLDAVDRFDAAFFGLSRREADQMDPQQRLLLECTWEAFEQAGIPPERWAGTKAGVFVGISSSDYAQLQPLDRTSVYWGTGNAHSIAANRLSYLLDLRGPSLAIDTACSSSLVAAHQAVRSLQLEECDRAVVAGVNILLMPALTDTFRQAGMLAPDGRCKPFDADADGYVRGEGCGVVLLKRLADARRDGDRIWGVICGSAVNQDGRSNGLTAPSGLAQQTVVTQALTRAGVAAAAIGYVETHGTGTSLGDPIEVNALRQVLGGGRRADQRCWLGSLKANLGHLEAAAGIAGLIKVLLCFRHGQIPPHLHLRTLNPLIQLQNSPLAINTSLEPWQGPGRYAGISSFGFGGTNAHLILAAPPEEPAAPQLPRSERPLHLLALSARSPEALDALRRRHAELLSERDLTPRQLADHCFSANSGRSQLPVRDAWIGATAGELAAALNAGPSRPRDGEATPTLAFLFTGQGSQYPGMAAELLASQPLFAQEIDRCDALLAELKVLPKGMGLRRLLSAPAAEDAEADALLALLERTAVTQPVLFSLEVALARLWMRWGVRPDWVMGHSVGEYAAACIAGVFDLESGLRLIAARARLMDALPEGGGMLAVFADTAAVQGLLAELAGPLVIAADNGPGNVVVSGPLDAIGQLETLLQSRGLTGRRLRVSHAFHSPLMEPMLAEFRAVAATVTFQAPTIPIVSNISHAPIGAEMADPDYWCRHVLAPVAFAESVRCLALQGVTCHLEIGPKPTLLEMARAGGLAPEATWLESLRPGRSDTQQMLSALAELHRHGVPIDWAGFDAPFPRRRVPLPTYPWQRERHWLPELRAGATVSADAGAASPTATDGPGLYAPSWVPQPFPTPVAAEPAEGQWLLIGPRPVQAWLLQALPSGQICCWIEAGDAFQEIHPRHWRLDPGRAEHWHQLFDALAAGPQILGILVAVTAPPAASGDPTIEAAAPEAMAPEALLRDSQQQPALARALLQCRWPTHPPRIWWIEAAAQSPQTTTAAALLRGAALGFGRCLALEHPGLWGGWLQLPDLAGEASAALLLRELGSAGSPAAAERSEGSAGELMVRHQDGAREVLRLLELPMPPAVGPGDPQGDPGFSPDGTVLISGGLGALGLATADWLVERGARALILVGRQPPMPQTLAQIETWRDRGVAVGVLQADVTEADFNARVSACLEAAGRPLRTIIHAAGILEDASIERLSPESWERVLRPKLLGAWALHALSLAHPVERFVLYSSLAAQIGSPGQCAYAAANAGLDALASHRRALGLPALSLNWGPWSGAGMAVVGHDRSGRSLASYGVRPEAAQVQLERLQTLLLADSGSKKDSVADRRTGAAAAAIPAAVAIASLEPRILAELMDGRPQRRFLAELADGLTPAAVPSDTGGGDDAPSPLVRELLKLPPQARAERMLTYLRGTLTRLLSLREEEIDADLHLMEAAADSLMVMDAISQIQRDLQLMLYPREIYEHPRLGALASYLAEAFNRSHSQASADAAAPSATVDLPEALRLPASIRSRPVAPARKRPGPVFVLSSPRAGSTLFRVMLAGHPQLFSPPELHLLPFATMGERARALSQSHLGEGLERALLELEGLEPAACRQQVRLWEEEDRTIADVYGRLQELAGGRRLVDKSPTYALHPETLRQAEVLFDRPRYIHLVRHPYAVIRSFVDLRMDRLFGAGDADPHRLAETIWRTCNANVLQLEEELGGERVQRVLYEDLVTRPEESLRDLCRFLGIPFDPALLAPYEGDRLTDGLHRQSLSVGDPNFRRHRAIDPSLAEAWRRVRLPWPLEESSQRLAERFGYSLPQERSGNQPPLPLRPTAPEDAAAGAAPAAPNGRRTAAQGLATTMREAELELGGLRLSRCEWGPETGQPVLCLHGLLDQGLIWEPVAERLAAAGFRVIAPDLRGHGRSDHAGPGGGYQSLDFIGDAVGLVDHLLDRPFLLIGHSLGSVVATGLTSLREHLVERLVLVEPVLPGSSGGSDVRESLATLVGYALAPPRHSRMADRQSAVMRLQRALPNLRQDFAERLVDRATRPEGNGLIWRWDPVLQTRMSLNLQSGPLNRSAYLQLLEGLQPPVSVIQGESSGFNRPEDLRDLRNALNRAEHRLLPGGHTLMVDNPDGVANALLTALRTATRP